MTPLNKRQKETTSSGPQHFLIEKLVQNKEIASFVCCLRVSVPSLPYNAKLFYILLHKVVSIFILKLKISITTESIGFSILGWVLVGPWWFLAILFSDLSLGMVLGYFKP